MTEEEEDVGILDFGFWILDFGFWILDFGLRESFALSGVHTFLYSFKI